MKITEAELCCDEQYVAMTDLTVDMTGMVIESKDYADTRVCVPLQPCKMRLLAKILNETADKAEGRI